jgi:hypothetical protein
MLMAHGCHLLPEGGVKHLQRGRCLLQGPAVSPASSTRVFVKATSVRAFSSFFLSTLFFVFSSLLLFSFL